MNFKCGCRPSQHDERTLKLTSYLSPQKIAVPDTCVWHKAIENFTMGGNDVYGDCVTCTAAHIHDCAHANESFDYGAISEIAIIQCARDNDALEGWSPLERLKVWRKVGMWGTKIEGYAAVKLRNVELLKRVIYEFGAADCAAYVPEAWLQPSNIWDVDKKPINKNNGHSFCLLGYQPDPDAGTVYWAYSWGNLYRMTQAAVDKYIIEIWAVLDGSWDADDECPSGFNHKQLLADARAL